VRRREGVFASAGAVGAALLSALCCMGPLLFVTVGVGAGLASAFEPFRPFLTFLTFGFLALGFWTVYGRPRAIRAAEGVIAAKVAQAEKAAGEGKGGLGSGSATDPASSAPADACALPRSRGMERVVLWVATVAALVFWSFPYWSLLLI